MSYDAATLFAALMIGTVGFAIFVYGKKQKRVPHLVAGITLMVYPYFVGSLAPMVGIAVAVLAGLFWVARQEIL